MKNDLISKSKLLEALRQEEDEYEEAMTTPSYWSAIRIIKEQPIAYDVEKIDKQIVDYFKMQVEKSVNVWNVVDFSCDIRKIVRNGGNTDVSEINVGNNGWIPVSERLPEESFESVIGWDEYRKRSVFVQYRNGRWILGLNETINVNITAWQPLPEPYTGEK